MFQWITTNINAIQATEKVMLAILMTTFCSIAIYHVFKTEMSKTLRLMIFGIALTAFGWALHRIYFSFYWYYRIIQDFDTAEAMLRWSIIPIVPMIGVVIGITFICTPLVIKTDSKFSWKPYLVILCGLFGLWWFILWKFISLGE